MRTKPGARAWVVWTVLVLIPALGAVTPGCSPAVAEPLEVTYYYLPG